LIGVPLLPFPNHASARNICNARAAGRAGLRRGLSYGQRRLIAAEIILGIRWYIVDS
jgi:hypothetical protein